MKIIAIIVLSSVSLYGQWITGFYQPGGGPTGEPFSAIPWNKYTHMQFWSAGAANTNDGKVCLGYLTQADINSFLASKSAGKKALVVIADATAGARGPDNLTCGDGNTWVANTAPGTIGTFVQNIVNFVNQAGQNNGGFDGVDLDWEGTINTTQYVDLITRLRAAMPTKIINIDVYPGAPTATAAAAQSSLDQVNVMCYDAGNYTSWSWYNGPVYNAVVNNGTSCDEKMFQVGGDNGAVSAGVPRAKIGVGIPYYGYRWTGCTQAMVSGCTRQNYFSYGILVRDATRWQSQYQRYDSTYKSNYLSIPSLNEFNSYNGVEFMSDVAAWAKANSFGGVMTFGQHDEYVSSQTGDARYPLSTALYSAVFGSATGTAPTITTTSLPAGTVAVAYSQTLAATGTGPITWSMAGGALPAGLSLNSSSGAITGSPTTTGTSSFTVQATNSAGTATTTLSIAINAPAGTPPTVTTSSVTSGTVGLLYSQTLAATGTGPITWSLASGALPAGLSLNSSGAITGTPTTSGTSSFTVQAANSAGTAQKALSIAINPSALANPSGGPYAYWKLDGSGSTAVDSSGNNLTANLSNAPSWMSGTSCVASGCLSFNGSNQYGSAALNLSDTSAITVSFWMNWSAFANDDKFALEFTPNFNNYATGFMIDPNSSANGGGQFEVGVQGDGGYNQVLFARPSAGWHHYAFVFNKGAAAANEVTPYVDGVAVPYTKPTNSENTNNFGSDTLYLMSRDGGALYGNGRLDEVQIYKTPLTGAQILALMGKTAPAITTTSLPAGTVAVAYSQTLAATGTGPITWSMAGGALPAGLSLNSSSGAITGTATTTGTSSFTVQAANSAGAATTTLSIAINAPAGTPPTVTTSSLTSGTVGLLYSQTLAATGTAPITWSLASGTLPAGLSLNSSTGAITGTPTTSGTSSFTVQAGNSAGTAQKALSIAINPSALANPSGGPYAYWKLDGSGSTAVDSSGNNLTANLSNAPSWMSGTSCVASGCLSFNGSNQYGSAALNLSDTSAITVSFWMNWSAFANDDKFAMELTPNFNNYATGFMIDPNSSANGGGQFEVGVQGDGGYNQVLFARPSAGWHHYAFVFNKGAAAANEVTPYVDGVAVPYTKPTNSENTNNFGSDTLYLMARNGGALYGAGRLDEVQIYKTPLTLAQIQSLATTSKPVADTKPPTISITFPGPDQVVSSKSQVTLTVNAADDVGVTRVQYQLDGVNLGNPVTTAPFNMVWNPARGWHTLTAMAWDAAGNSTSSTPVKFRVR